MRSVLFLLIMNVCFFAKAQIYEYNIKEHYDIIYKEANDYIDENGYNNATAYTSESTFGNLERIGNIIESNIVYVRNHQR